MDGLDVLVNNAGVSEKHQLTDIDYETWQSVWTRVIDANLTAPGNLSYCAVKKMIQRGGGRIVNISSRGAFRGEPLMPWYGASKAGFNSMGQSMAQALGAENIFVYTVAPGFVETGMATEVLKSAAGENIRKVANRPGRVEPRAIKRRPKAYSLLTVPKKPGQRTCPEIRTPQKALVSAIRA